MSDPAAAEPGSSGSRRIWVVGLLALALLTVLIAREPLWTAPVQSLWFDAFQLMDPRHVETTPAVVVEIDDDSLKARGQWPWPRTMMAELIRDIEKYQPKAIGVDILMPDPDRLSPQQLLAPAREKDPLLAARLAALPSNDAELAAAIGAGPVVLGLVGTPEATGKILRTAPVTALDCRTGLGVSAASLNFNHLQGVLPSIDELDRAAVGHGLMSAVGPAQGIIRSIPLVTDINGTLTPALAIEMLRVGLRAPLRLCGVGSAVQTIFIEKSDQRPIVHFVVPTDEGGAVRIYYSKRDPRRYLPAIDVLNGHVDPQKLSGKLVLVGVTGTGLTDYQNTPVGEPMPGSEIHAQLLENLYDQTWLTRPSWARAFELVLFVLLGLLLIWATPRWKPLNAALLAAACVVLPALASYAAFKAQRQLFDAATTGTGLLLLFATLLVLTLAESTRRRKSLERVVQAQRVQAAYISGELQAAQRIQIGILPRADSLRYEHRIDLYATMTPAREVGGDLYDFFLLDAHRLFFMVGDVAGKGLSASIFMAISKALYKSTTLRQPEATISELMRAANDEVSRDNPEMFFVTVFAGILDLDSGALSYCNAGHENPDVLDANGSVLTRLDDGAGPPLCTVEHFPYIAGTHAMQRGELLCLVTDGVVDAQNPAGQRYGSDRLQAVLARARNGETTAHAVVDAVRADVQSFVGTAEPADDVTVLALRWLGRSTTS